jgi:hypothetical protein
MIDGYGAAAVALVGVASLMVMVAELVVAYCPRALRHIIADVRPPRTHALGFRVFLVLFFIL